MIWEAAGSKYLGMKEIQVIVYFDSVMEDVALWVIIVVDYWNRSHGAEEKFILDEIVKSLKLFPP